MTPRIALCLMAALLTLAAADLRAWTDELGRRLTAPRHPARILSYAPNLTETLFAIGAADRLVGRTRYCDWPAEARRVAVFGGILDPDFEKIASLRPDLILATTAGDPPDKVEAMTRLGYPVFVTDPRTVEAAIAGVERIGHVVDAEAGARRVAGRMRAELAEVRRRVGTRPPVRTLVVVWQDPLVTVGRGTFFADLIREAGGDPLLGEGKGNYPRVSMEWVLGRAPEVIVLGLRGHPGGGEARFWDRFPTLPAVRQGRIHAFDLQVLGRPGPRITTALGALARKLHPEAFDDAAPASEEAS
jgi:iron complex transport system substrate-binding protein